MTELRNKFISKTFEILISIKYYHFQTESFSDHKIMDDFYTEMNTLFDEVAEMLQGLFGKTNTTVFSTEITLWKSNTEAVKGLTAYYNWLDKWVDGFDIDTKKKFNIINAKIDEIKGLINRKYYLLSLQ